MELRELRYFLEVAKQRSFSKASQTLHLSQPTLSKVVKHMEQELQVTLFDRSTRHIHLTDAGEIVHKHAQMMKQCVVNLQIELAAMTQLNKGHVKLGLPPVIGSSYFPGIIAAFHQRYPHITLQLQEEGSKLVEHSLLKGTIDLGVVVLPVDEEQFELMPIIDRKLKLVVNINHPFAKQKEIDLHQLKNESFIMFRQGFSLYDRVREACISQGFEPIIKYESTQWDFMIEMIKSDLGIAFLPETICEKLYSADGVCVIESTQPVIPWNLGMIWRKNDYVSHAAQAWIDFVRKSFL